MGLKQIPVLVILTGLEKSKIISNSYLVPNERLGINFDKGPLVDKVTMSNKYF
jgi:hypothetical protein